MSDIDMDLFNILMESKVDDVEIDCPERLNMVLKEFDYGYIKDGKPYTGNNFDKYKTIDPKTFEKYRIGTCWDYTAYEYEYFKKEFDFDKLKSTAYFIQEEDGKDNPSHTWLAYETNGYTYIFEASWKKYKGIFEYESKDKMLKDYIKKFLRNNGTDPNIAKYIVLEFVPPTKYGLTSDKYLKYIYNNSKVVLNHGISDWDLYY